MTRDEFGGYCCKRWGNSTDAATSNKRSKASVKKGKEKISSEDNICELLGLDINRTALEIVKADFKRKDIPLSEASKYLVAMNPHSTHSSAVKSFNASVPT